MALMYSRAKVSGRPLHPMLVAFPVTFYTTTLIGFSAYAVTQNPFWWQVGLGSNWVGVITAIVASVPGLVDYRFGIPRGTKTKARETGFKHMLLNLCALLVFGLNLVLQGGTWELLRQEGAQASHQVGDAAARMLAEASLPDLFVALGLSWAGWLMTLFAGFLGWTLVQVHHVGVDLTDEQCRLEAELPRAGGRSLVQS